MIYIPQPTIERLIVYYRFLGRNIRKREKNYISSLELGDKLKISPVVIRKDLSFCGKRGCKGVGYEVYGLRKAIEKVLCINQTCSVILIGAGNFGRALMNAAGFDKIGIKITAAFDCDLNKIGQVINGVKIYSIKNLEEIIKKISVKAAILTVPADEAYDIAFRIVRAGVKAIWNFAPVTLELGDNVLVYANDISPGIGSLIYRLNN